MRFIDIFDSPLFQNIIITQNVWEYVKQKSIKTYKKLNKFVYEDKDPRFSVFMSEFHHKTFVRPEPGLSDSLRREKVLYVCADYLNKHWAKRGITPIILCAEDDVQARLKNSYEYSFTIKDYVQGWPLFLVSRENYREATVLVDSNTMTSWFITGLNCNRAIDGDIVAVQLLPEEEWTLPERKVRLRDVEDLEMKADDEPEADDSEETPKPKRVKLAAVPTAKADILENQRIVVSIDQWPRDSRYPLGHYVRALGKIGDREIENEVLLLEHDIPHAPFSDGVLECLPSEDWQPDLQPPRVDLRHLTICSVDPLGCTDIDDALHCRPLDNGLLEVGVHIADVTHFVRAGTAIDDEAASRATTVYLCDRRIDMLPERLSSNLCSLRGGEERYAFSVIWTMAIRASRSLGHQVPQVPDMLQGSTHL
ncbi:RNB-like protein [Cooperia oncophora]